MVAVAALERLGLGDRISEVLDPAVLLPQAAQGALGVECRADDAATVARLAAIDDEPRTGPCARNAPSWPSWAAGAACRAARSRRSTAGGEQVVLEALLAALDGSIVLRTQVTGPDAAEVGARAARDLLDAKGGRALLDRELSA